MQLQNHDLQAAQIQKWIRKVPGASNVKILQSQNRQHAKIQLSFNGLPVVHGRLIGVELAEEMARTTNAEAAHRGISARVQVMDAEYLDFADSTFDRVLCGFGIMFFPNQERALEEFRRVMKSGGRLAVSTWKVELCAEVGDGMKG